MLMFLRLFVSPFWPHDGFLCNLTCALPRSPFPGLQHLRQVKLGRGMQVIERFCYCYYISSSSSSSDRIQSLHSIRINDDEQHKPRMPPLSQSQSHHHSCLTPHNNHDDRIVATLCQSAFDRRPCVARVEPSHPWPDPSSACLALVSPWVHSPSLHSL